MITLEAEPQYSMVEYPEMARNQFHELKPTRTTASAKSRMTRKLSMDWFCL